jgi:hypothetical protein
MTRRSTTTLASAVLLLLAQAVPVSAQEAEGLADAFPDQLGGAPLEVIVRSGPDWVAGFDASVDTEAAVISLTESLLTGVEATLDDLTIASALHTPSPGNVATISAVQVRDTAAHELVNGSIALLLGDVIAPELEVVFAGGRDVLKVRDTEMPGGYPRTLVPSGDTLWVIEAEPPLLDEIVAALPAAAERPGPVFDMAANAPLELAGNKRVYLLVSSGWDFVYWQSQNYPEELETIALDSYLASGIPIDAVTTTSSVWVDDEGAIGAVLAAYQFAGADDEVLEALLEDIVLPNFEGLDSTHEPGSLGGRDVTILRDSTLLGADGTPRPVYIYVSGDTIFALDAAEDAAATAIAALP